MKRIWFCFALGMVVVCCAVLVGCGQLTAPSSAKGSDNSLRVVTDATGAVVQVPQKPCRIVTLTLATDEIVMELVGPERIAAVSFMADDDGISNVAGQAKKVWARAGGDAEAILALHPDLVLTPDWWRVETGQTLRQMGVPVYIYKVPNGVASVKDSIRSIAEAVNEPQRGEKMIANMDAVLNDVAQRTDSIKPENQKTVVWFSSMSAASGKGSHFEDLCRYARVNDGAALAGVKRGEVLSKEALIQVNPDILLLPNWTNKGQIDTRAIRQEVESDPAYRQMKAVQNHQLAAVADRYLYCVSQYIVYGVRDIASAAYPNLFE